jgi:PAS domain S-box-containing protein
MMTASARTKKAPSAGAPDRPGLTPPAGESRLELAQAAMALANRRFLPAAACVGLVYVVAAIHQIVLPSGPSPWLPALLSAIAAWACYVLGFLVYNHLVPVRVIHSAAVGLVVIILAQQTALVRFAGQAPDPLPYMLLLIAVGGFFVEGGWLFIAVSMIWLSWLSFGDEAALFAGQHRTLDLLYLLQSAPSLALAICTVVGLFVFAVQARFFRQTQLVRINRQRLAGIEPPAITHAVTEEHPFRQLTAASIEPVVVHENGLILEASGALGEMLGCPAADLVGRSLLDLVAPDARTKVTASLFLGNLAPAETTLQRLDGTVLPVEIFSKNTTHLGRRVTVTTIRNIAERRQMVATIAEEQQRTEQSYRLQAALAALDFALDEPGQLDAFLNDIALIVRDTLNVTGAAFIVLAEEGSTRLRVATRLEEQPADGLAASALLRYRGATAWVLANRQPMAVADVRHDPFAEEHRLDTAGIQSYAAFPLVDEGRCLGVLFVLDTKPRARHSGELNFLTALAQRAALAVVKVGLFERMRQTNALLETQRGELQAKNGELATARDAAEAAGRAKSKFFDTISHELRTPMHGVLGMTHLLMGTPISEEQREYATTIQSSAESLLKMIDDVLEFTQLDAVNGPLKAEPLDVREFLDSIVQTVTPRARNKGLALQADLDATLPGRITSDRSRLRHLLQILLGNAIKFTSAGGITLRVRGEAAGDQPARLRFEITDTGPGFPEELLPRLFEPFTQADGSMSRRHGGLGLGLALARQIDQRLGGEIGAHNAPDGGAVVWFTVPFRPSAAL